MRAKYGACVIFLALFTQMFGDYNSLSPSLSILPNAFSPSLDTVIHAICLCLVKRKIFRLRKFYRSQNCFNVVQRTSEWVRCCCVVFVCWREVVFVTSIESPSKVAYSFFRKKFRNENCALLGYYAT